MASRRVAELSNMALGTSETREVLVFAAVDDRRQTTVCARFASRSCGLLRLWPGISGRLLPWNLHLTVTLLPRTGLRSVAQTLNAIAFARAGSAIPGLIREKNGLAMSHGDQNLG